MTRISVEYGVRTDPGDKPVDVIAAPRGLWICSYEPAPENDRAVILELAIELLGGLAAAKAKAIRERELVLWWGETVAEGKPLRIVGFPQRLHSAVHEILRPLVRLRSRLDFGDYAFTDTGTAPLAGYDHGRIVAYTDPFEARHAIAGAQLRSAEVRVPSPKPPRRDPISRLTTTHGPHYSIDLWQRARNDVLEAIGQLLGAASYASLRRLLTTELQIPIVGHTGGRFAMGRVSAGWLVQVPDGEPACGARIELRTDMAPELRYVVLAHELAHFLLHFPLLLCAQLVEESSWEMPALEGVWRAIVNDALPCYEELERHADQLTVQLLIPPRYFPMRHVAEIIMVGSYGSPNPHQLVWHFLQPLFPDTAEKQYGWVNWDEHEQRAAEQVKEHTGAGLDGQGLYARMLSAGLAVERDEYQGLHRAVSDAIPEITGATFAAVKELAALDPAEQEGRAQELIAARGADAAEPALPRDIAGRAASREIVPPARPTGRLPPRLPLVPARRGRGGLWESPLRDDPAAATPTWQTREPNRALVLYREAPELP